MVSKNREISTKAQTHEIKSLDMLGEKFSLAFSSANGTFQTTLGGLITILMSILTISAFVIIFSQYFNTSAPMVTTSAEFASNKTTFNMYEHEIITPLALTIQGEFITAEAPRYVTIFAEVRGFAHNKQTDQFEETLLFKFPYIPCDQVTDKRTQEIVLKLMVIPKFLSSNLCPEFSGNPNEYLASQDQKNSQFRAVKLLIYPCSLPDPSQCASPREVNIVTITFSRFLRLVDPSDYEDPLRQLPRKEDLRLDSSNSKFRNYMLQGHKVLDDTLQLRPPKVKLEFATANLETIDTSSRDPNQVHCSAAQIEMGPRGGCQEYMKFDFTATGEVEVIRRNYKQFTTIMGEFGGMLKLMTTFVFIFYSVYNSKKVKKYFAESILKLGASSGSDEESLKKILDKAERRDRRKVGLQNHLKEALGKESGASVGLDDEPIPAKEVVAECVRSRTNAVDMMDKLNFIEYFEEFMLDEHERTLLPLMLIKIKERKMKETRKRLKEQRRRELERRGQDNNIRKIFQQPRQDRVHKAKKGSTYEQAYQKLLESTPESGIKQKMKEFSLELLKDFFDKDETMINQNGALTLSMAVGKPEDEHKGVFKLRMVQVDSEDDSDPEAPQESQVVVKDTRAAPSIKDYQDLLPRILKSPWWTTDPKINN